MMGFTKRWNNYLASIQPDDQDLYFREEYIKLYETEHERAECFVYQKGESVFLFPFLCRTFEFRDEIFHDFETAYGYGGPITNNHSEEFLKESYAFMQAESIKNNYICGFVRFHPILNNIACFNTIGEIIPDRKTIAIDLSHGIDSAWMNEIHTKNRNVIKKGEKNNLEFVADDDFTYLSDFETLYDSTMDKLEADDFYYFKPSYYDQLSKNIRNKFLGIVKHAGIVIAGAIFFYQIPYGHYHLAGSDKHSLSLSPNNFLLWEAAKELSKRGVKYFHIGGGTDGSIENSLYQYKRKFSKNEYQFNIGKVIFNQGVYNDICAEWTIANPEKAIKLKNLLLKYKY